MPNINILGISHVGDSGVSLFVDGELKLAVNEERLSRIKLDGSYPNKAIEWCLKEANLFPQDINLICYGFTNGMKQGKFISDMNQRLKKYLENPEVAEIILQRISTESEIDLRQKKIFIKETNKIFPNVPIYFCHHHETHQACALMSSPFTDALVVTADGRGDYTSITISEAKDGVLGKLLYRNYSWESLGYFYGRITHLCGFVAQRHEGKTMGLAATGDPSKAMSLMKKMIDFDGENIVSFPGKYYRPFFSNYSKELIEEAKKFSKEDLAAAAQKHLETMVTNLISKHARETGLKNICVAGGLFANVKLNQEIKKLPEINNIFVYPNMGDGGLCAGSVYHYFMDSEKKKPNTHGTIYLGPKINNEKIKSILESNGAEIQTNNINKKVIEILNSKKIIGLVQGRAEFGPRALGNRSILAACDIENKNFSKSLNERLGRTEFMPFAPAIASDLAHLCLKDFNHEFSSRHMTINYDATDAFKKNSPPIVHVDGTVRPQIVYKKDNPFFYSLLMDWFRATGGLCLVNTSFNFHEDPIVSNNENVISYFMRNAVDYLLFPPYLCKFDTESSKKYLNRTEKQDNL